MRAVWFLLIIGLSLVSGLTPSLGFAQTLPQVRLVLCTPKDSALASRAQGQLVDLQAVLLFAEPVRGTQQEQLRKAREYARQYRAPLVAWLRTDPEPELAVWHARDARLELRALPASSPSAPTAASSAALPSATLESAALLLRSTVRTEQLLARAVPASPSPPPTPPPPPPPSPPTQVLGFVDLALRMDGAGGTGEPWILVGTEFGDGTWSWGAGGGWMPTRTLGLPLVSATISGLRLYGHVGRQWLDWNRLRLSTHLRAGWVRSVRRARATDSDVLTLPDRISDAALLSGTLGLSYSFGVIVLRVGVGLDAVLPTKRYRVADLESDRTYAVQPHRLAPTASLGIGVSF